MKKLTAFLVCLLALTLSAFAADSVVLSCGNVEANPGEEITVPVNITSNPGFMYLALTPEYDATALGITVANGSLISDFTQGKQLVWVSDNDVSATGVLCTLKIQVSSGAAPGEYTVRLVPRGCYDSDEENVGVNTVSFTVTVKGEEPTPQALDIVYVIDSFSTSEGVKIKVMFSDGSISTLGFDGSAGSDYLSAAAAGEVYQYSINAQGKIRLLKYPKNTSEVIFKKESGRFDYDEKTIAGYAIDENSIVFVRYNVKASDAEPSYMVIKASELKNGADGNRFTVAAHSAKSDPAGTVVAAVYDALIEQAPNGGRMPGETDTKLVFITDKEHYKAYDPETGTTKAYIRGIDIKKGTVETFAISNTNSNDAIFREATEYTDLRCCFFEAEPDGDEYVFTPIGVSAGWVIDRVDAVSDGAIELKNRGAVVLGEDTYSDVKVYIRNGNDGVAKSSFGAITAAREGASNIALYYDGADVYLIIYSSDPSKDVAGGYWKDVATPLLSSIAVKTLPSKTSYTVGETPDFAGLTLTATYSDSSTQTVMGGFTTSSVSTATAGTKTVTVTYQGKTATFEINVIENNLEPDPVLDADPQIFVQSVIASAGETVSVDVFIKNNPGIAYLEITPVFANELTLTNVQNGELISDFTKNKQYIWVADEDVMQDGRLLTLTFSIPADTPSGDYKIGFILRSCTDYNEQLITLAVVQGKVAVKNGVDHDWKYTKNSVSFTVTDAPQSGNIAAVYYAGNGRMISISAISLNESNTVPEGVSRIKLLMLNDLFVPRCKAGEVK